MSFVAPAQHGNVLAAHDFARLIEAEEASDTFLLQRSALLGEAIEAFPTFDEAVAKGWLHSLKGVRKRGTPIDYAAANQRGYSLEAPSQRTNLTMRANNLPKLVAFVLLDHWDARNADDERQRYKVVQEFVRSRLDVTFLWCVQTCLKGGDASKMKPSASIAALLAADVLLVVPVLKARGIAQIWQGGASAAASSSVSATAATSDVTTEDTVCAHGSEGERSSAAAASAQEELRGRAAAAGAAAAASRGAAEERRETVVVAHSPWSMPLFRASRAVSPAGGSSGNRGGASDNCASSPQGKAFSWWHRTRRRGGAVAAPQTSGKVAPKAQQQERQHTDVPVPVSAWLAPPEALRTVVDGQPLVLWACLVRKAAAAPAAKERDLAKGQKTSSSSWIKSISQRVLPGADNARAATAARAAAGPEAAAAATLNAESAGERASASEAGGAAAEPAAAMSLALLLYHPEGLRPPHVLRVRGAMRLALGLEGLRPQDGRRRLSLRRRQSSGGFLLPGSVPLLPADAQRACSVAATALRMREPAVKPAWENLPEMLRLEAQVRVTSGAVSPFSFAVLTAANAVTHILEARFYVEAPTRSKFWLLELEKDEPVCEGHNHMLLTLLDDAPAGSAHGGSRASVTSPSLQCIAEEKGADDADVPVLHGALRLDEEPPTLASGSLPWSTMDAVSDAVLATALGSVSAAAAEADADDPTELRDYQEHEAGPQCRRLPSRVVIVQQQPQESTACQEPAGEAVLADWATLLQLVAGCETTGLVAAAAAASEGSSKALSLREMLAELASGAAAADVVVPTSAAGPLAPLASDATGPSEPSKELVGEWRQAYALLFIVASFGLALFGLPQAEEGASGRSSKGSAGTPGALSSQRPDELKLVGQKVTAKGLLKIAHDAMLHGHEMNRVELDSTPVTGGALSRLLQELQWVETLVLDKSLVCGVSLLAKRLAGNRTLHKLQVLNTRLEPQDCAALATLARTAMLAQLDLSGSTVGDEGAAEIARILQDSPLKWLALRNCGIGKTGVQTLLRLVETSSGLRMDLAGNQLQNDGGSGGGGSGAKSWSSSDIAKGERHKSLSSECPSLGGSFDGLGVASLFMERSVSRNSILTHVEDLDVHRKRSHGSRRSSPTAAGAAKAGEWSLWSGVC